MDICVCEIDRRWPESCQARIAMLEELVRRGLLGVKSVHQHGRIEAVWTPVTVWQRERPV